MADILDYIAWRGDITFDYSPFNEVDSLIFSQLAYLDFSNIIPESIKNKITLSQAWELFRESGKSGIPGILFNKKTQVLLPLLANTVRFKNLELSGFRSEINEKEEIQFLALTVRNIGKKKTAIVFTGTDDTLTGWKEDFNMAYMDSVPAQKHAVEYLESAASSFSGNFIICGHSKGGNLASYSAAFSNPKTRKRIEIIYNNDGPGFTKKVLAKGAFSETSVKTRHFIPQASIVGTLLYSKEKARIIESSENQLRQHDPFSWLVKGCHFISAKDFSAEALMFDKTLKEWLLCRDENETKEFVTAFFNMLSSTGATTVTELFSELKDNPPKFLLYIAKLDSKIKRPLHQALKELFKIAGKILPKEIPGLLNIKDNEVNV